MGKRVRYPNIVDERLKYLVSVGVMKDSKDDSMLLWKQEYWDEFVRNCDNDIVDYVLSFPQSGNWNGWLYAACEKRRGRKPNR